ncbi:hypothetical protein COB55_05150 [Candidatus Wolfebacteria bacterium]|nr:MAG: hypothetical protein COB55_05150 [Candidatus Wolfebacteria bacterium]
MRKFKVGDFISPDRNFYNDRKKLCFTKNKSYEIIDMMSASSGPRLNDDTDFINLHGIGNSSTKNHWYNNFHKSSYEEICLTEILEKIQNKHWFNNKLENHIEINDDMVTIKRKCATKIYKNTSRLDRLQKLDLWFIEIIDPILEKYNIIDIKFSSNFKGMGYIKMFGTNTWLIN